MSFFSVHESIMMPPKGGEAISNNDGVWKLIAYLVDEVVLSVER
jgi:hypothetical protein